ncbi:DUF4282 domain-containing protein [Isoptericola croceus]|uniref:DUF4282 domain-containing protein n=1 Tax=Isoptericola croceus TaxID=3031406 RepID=UPI0023F67B24|nr:DUF4282 domain-containing protein [Isoptericola croceus]
MSENTPRSPGQPDDPYGQQPPSPGPPQQPHQQQPPLPYEQPIGERPVGEQPAGDQPFYAGAASSAANVARNDTKGFFGALFDYSFMNYVTPKVVKIVYVIVTVLVALGWLVALVAAFANSVWAGIGFLLFGWIIALVYLAIARITLEFYLAVVSISEKVNHYARRDGIV